VTTLTSEAATARSPSDIPEAAARVLVADDDRSTREQLAALLRTEGHTVEMCEDGQEAIGRVAQGGIDLVLLDVMMPRLSGTETCRLIKGMSAGSFLPIILVTAKNDAVSRAEGLRLGADDYVGKPFDAEELSARVAGMLRIKRMVGNLTDDRERLLRRAVHDDLTGLANRRHFEARLAEERKRAERHHEPFACLLIDIGGAVTSRDVNAGALFDRLVARGASAVKRSVREGDVVARYGDGTFAALLPHTHFAGTIAASERILRDVATALGDAEDEKAGVSIGAALYPSRDARTPEAILRTAEAALDEARREGGGRICVFQQRKYLYTPGTGGAPRSERPSLTSDRPSLTGASRRFTSEPPESGTELKTREPGDRKG